MKRNNVENRTSKPARKEIFPMGIGITLGIVLGVALDNIAIGLAVGIIIAGIVIIWQKKK